MVMPQRRGWPSNIFTHPTPAKAAKPPKPILVGAVRVQDKKSETPQSPIYPL